MSRKSITQKWKGLPRNKKGYVFLAVGCATAAAFIGSMAVNTSTGTTAGSTRSNTIYGKCADYASLSGSSAFVYEGVSCETCVEIGDTVSFAECSNTCSDWVVDPIFAVMSPVLTSCDIVEEPEVTPEFVCPEGFYTTHSNIGCIADTIEEVIAFQNHAYLLGTDPTVEDCFEACETADDCAGVAVAFNGTSCFGFDTSVADLCVTPMIDSTICKRIEPHFECYEGPETFENAQSFCEGLGFSLAEMTAVDEFRIELARLSKACESDLGCFFDAQTPECFYVGSDGTLQQDASCTEDRGFCCEVPTDAPTISPTSSPTYRLFFVPECDNDPLAELSYDEARSCCLESGGDLAAIHTHDEQLFAWDVCLEALTEGSNDCGCWIGYARDSGDVSVDPADFNWIDGSSTVDEYTNWEQYPVVQPNNEGNRNEACVHMRPFTAGGWNDLPCSGYCDAKDTKPYPLCRAFTPSPTTSPTRSPTSNPTYSPTNLPTTSPTRSPSLFPTTSPTTSPTSNPTTSPTKSPTISPTRSPTTSPTTAPTRSPTTSPTKSPTRVPTTSPTHAPTVVPTSSPTVSPTGNPTSSPSTSPTTSPTVSPTTSPTTSPTSAPTTSPTSAPTKSPTTSPTHSPTGSPTGSPTISPLACEPPDGECTYDDGEAVFIFTNPHTQTISFQYWFSNPTPGVTVAGRAGFYPDCLVGSCQSYIFSLEAGDELSFSAPATEITVIYTAGGQTCEVSAEASSRRCTCVMTTPFNDDFDSYFVTNGLTVEQDPTFFDNWAVTPGTIDIKGYLRNEDGSLVLRNGNPVPSSSFYSNPCLNQTSCVDIDGTVFFEPDNETLSAQPIQLEPSQSFYNRICTMNFYARGNARCGTLHNESLGINDRPSAIQAGCVQFYANNPVPLTDNLTVQLFEDNSPLVDVIFEEIPWNQDWEPFGITGDVSNGATEIFGSFTVVSGKLAPEEGGGNIGPLLDNVQFRCCCPAEEDRYIGRVVEANQGKTELNLDVPLAKSDFSLLVNSVVSIQELYGAVDTSITISLLDILTIDLDVEVGPKPVYALGLGGDITLEFALGATNYIWIYEESHVCCCCSDYDPEDAIVEASVDGYNWIIVKESFKGDWEVIPGGDNSIRRSKVVLPNGACFKYIRITDNSVGDCDAADGFDLVAIEVGDPCCPIDMEPLPTVEDDSESVAFAGAPITVVAGLYAVVAVGLSVLAVLTVITVADKATEELNKESARDIEENIPEIEEIPPVPASNVDVGDALATKEL